MFNTTKIINTAYYQDECHIFLVYGPLGMGKSSYALKTLAELYGSYEKAKDYIVFEPKDFVRKCIDMSERKVREKAIVWDDAGYWLFYMKHTDPLVMAVEQYLNVARTNWAGIIFTTPTPTWVIHKLRHFPQNISIKIVKAKPDHDHPLKPRLAKGYRNWVAPDFRHSGVRSMFIDKFNAMLPKDFFWEWYKPLRDSYARLASQNMWQSIRATENAMRQANEQVMES